MHLSYIFLCISPPVPPEDPVVEGSPELLLMAGTPYNLTCVTRGAKPAAHIQWTKDGAAVEGAYQSTVTHTRLHIRMLSQTHVHRGRDMQHTVKPQWVYYTKN